LAVSAVTYPTSAHEGVALSTLRMLDASYTIDPAPEESTALSLFPGPTRFTSKAIIGERSAEVTPEIEASTVELFPESPP
jgi:hypothetical protein